MLDFDLMLVHVGEFGLYQKILFVFQAPFCIFVTFVLFGQLFMTLYPNVYWCEDHFRCTRGNMTPVQRQNFSFPFMNGMINPCFMNNINRTYIAAVSDWANRNITDADEDDTNIRQERCQMDPCILNNTVNIRNFISRAEENIKSKPQYGKRVQRRYRIGKVLPQYTESDYQFYQTTTPSNKPDFKSSTEKFQYAETTTNKNSSMSSLNANSRTCTTTLNVQLRNTTIIMTNSPPLVPVNNCTNISWDRNTSGVAYDTIVTEGNWWCNADTYVAASQSIFFVGAIVGGFIIGWIADTAGRVPALVIANLLGAVGGALSVTTTNIWLFLFFRFITGMAFDNCFTMMYILVLEFSGPRYRTLVANLSIAIFYTFGTLLLPWLAVWIGDWKVYGLAISLPMLLGLLALFIVPESARWLLSKGRATEATEILRSFAKVNRRHVDERIFIEFEEGAKKLYEELSIEEEEASLLAVFKTPRLRKTFIILVFMWAFISLVYDGHSRNILNLANEQWSVFTMFTIASMTEFPADMFLIFTLDRFGRRWIAFGSLFFSGAFSLISATIQPVWAASVGLVFAVLSRFCVNVAFNVGLQYAAELLPTVIRAQGVNAIHIMGYAASVISPFVAQIGRTNRALSLILLGAFAMIGGVLALFLTETLGEDLPNTLEEAETFGRHQSFWNCPICSRPTEEEQEKMETPDQPVKPRNILRASVRGETYRSSIISNSSSRTSTNPSSIMMNPGAPTETTNLRRVYTR